MADPVKETSVADTVLPKKDLDAGDVESYNGESGVANETARVLDHAAEVRLCRKFDFRILPFLSIMCKCRLQVYALPSAACNVGQC